MDRICAVYFSPTGGTKKIVLEAAAYLSESLGIKVEEHDITRPENREEVQEYGNNTLVVLGLPTYAGRIPNKILPFVDEKLKGSGQTPVVTISVFGNRNYDESMHEVLLLSEKNGFIPIGAAACVSRHAFTDRLAPGRADESDLEEIRDFCGKIAEKIRSGRVKAVNFDRENPAGPYYTPKKEDGTPAKFLKAKPKTDPDKCVRCGKCIRVCSMGSIGPGPETVDGICIKCQACVRGCPVKAKYFDDADFLSHVAMLEKNFTENKKNTFVLE